MPDIVDDKSVVTPHVRFRGEQGKGIENDQERQNWVEQLPINAQKAINAGDYATAYNEVKSTNVGGDRLFEIFYYDTFVKKGISRKKITPLELTLEEECVALGFKPLVNPFITFLLHYLPTGDISTFDYNVLHNSYINGLIDNDDLNGKSPDQFNHIIFNPNLYNSGKRDTEIIKYLKTFQFFSDPRAVESKLGEDTLNNKPLQQFVGKYKLQPLNLSKEKDLKLFRNILIFGSNNPKDKLRPIDKIEYDIETFKPISKETGSRYIDNTKNEEEFIKLLRQQGVNVDNFNQQQLQSLAKAIKSAFTVKK